ncbi:bifunctional peptidase and arginyl-hydroxylase JMJD5-like [Bemisia tabaci]
MYAAASLLKSIAIVNSLSSVEDEKDIKGPLQNSLKSADMGLLLGADFREELTNIAHILSSTLHTDSSNQSPQAISIEKEAGSFNPTNQIHYNELTVLECPSMEFFHFHHFKPRIPVKISGCMSHWPALKKWRDVSYFQQLAGSRTVPVELGSNYLESNWSQSLMTLSTFIDKYINCESSSPISENATPTIGYLAQHQLFDQIPELKKDIFEPEYCCLMENPDIDPEGTDVNAWFGPKGTVSPLHYDPKHNLLCQVVGTKQVVLFSPEDSSNVYPHEGTLVSNSAMVDPENPDFEKFPKFQEATGYTCLLKAGEMLYIPPKWWHHVRSLSTSFSVSFWWM